MIIDDLLAGVFDDDGGVRNDAIRALEIIADYGKARPELKIHISPEPFIQLMKSVSCTDRNKAAFILLSLTADRDKRLLFKLKNEILAARTDMALWKSEGHAMPGYIMLGRIAGWSDKEIFDSSKNNREEMVNNMLGSIK